MSAKCGWDYLSECLAHSCYSKKWWPLLPTRESMRQEEEKSSVSMERDNKHLIISVYSLYSEPIYFFSHLFFISWRLITLQYCSGFCHTLTWISHGFTCVPHPDPPSHLPLPDPSGSSRCTRPKHLSHASNLHIFKFYLETN